MYFLTQAKPRSIIFIKLPSRRSQWPCGLRRRSAAARLLRLWFRIPLGAWISVCCVLSGKGLCDELITRHSSRGVLPTVVRGCVWSRNLVIEEALAHWRLSRLPPPKKKKHFHLARRLSCMIKNAVLDVANIRFQGPFFPLNWQRFTEKVLPQFG